jgi:hypothetical protein
VGGQRRGRRCSESFHAIEETETLLFLLSHAYYKRLTPSVGSLIRSSSHFSGHFLDGVMGALSIGRLNWTDRGKNLMEVSALNNIEAAFL